MARNLASYGLYPSIGALYSGAEALKAAGFRQTDISVLYPDKSETASPTSFGTLIAYLAGIGAITFPGVGPFLAAGPIASAFKGLGVAASGLLGSLRAIGLPEYMALRYEGRLKQGGLMMTVHCDDDEWAGRANNIQTGQRLLVVCDLVVCDGLSPVGDLLRRHAAIRHLAGIHVTPFVDIGQVLLARDQRAAAQQVRHRLAHT
jgi:hypothetical protein